MLHDPPVVTACFPPSVVTWSAATAIPSKSPGQPSLTDTYAHLGMWRTCVNIIIAEPGETRRTCSFALRCLETKLRLVGAVIDLARTMTEATLATNCRSTMESV